MIDLNATNEWQHRDPSNGLVLPWYVKSFLLELMTWDLSERIVFEFGAGSSTLWWADKAERVYSVESNEQYLEAVRSKDVAEVYYAGIKENYLKFVTKPAILFDIIIIDGEPIAWRDDCVQPALNCLKPGGKLIIDNWLQPSVGWMPIEETQRLLAQYPSKVYHQEGHVDWKTAVWTKQ